MRTKQPFERLRQAREAAGYASAAEAARALSMKPATYTHHENGTRAFSKLSAIMYARKFGVDPSWLLFGDGKPVHSPDPAPVTQQVPLLSWVSAGQLNEVNSTSLTDALAVLNVSDLGHGDFFALHVVGDSMDRVSPDGSLIIVDRSDQQLIPDKFYVFGVRGEATYKRWLPDPPSL
jgi:SOS-response transcriptional repressor LexA